jgi:ECF transporter S component (folate family)
MAHALAGWILGPFWAVGTAVAGDILGLLINSGGRAFFPGYTLSAALSGTIYGLILYRGQVRALACLASVSSSVLLVSLCLTSFWNAIYYSRPWLEAVLAALPWRLVSIPIYAITLIAVQKGMYPAVKRYIPQKS